MVTAWSSWRMDRTRFGAGPLLRVLALAVLLFGVLVSHGAYVETANGHLSTSASTPAALSADDIRHAGAESGTRFTAEAAGHHGDHESSHPGEQCVSGQPQQGPALAAPCFAASIRESNGAHDASVVRVPASGGPMGGASPAALRAASVVQQV
ncbi:hypothetical protein GCM10009601_04240 [Streptomyces thermospinosisporus]|uniref:Uncharacterized protein n=1 Tax=Streptomyces thermospinosisporus TaxID=161482 RepID=A0ABN1YKP6_9ACTN